MLDRKNIHSFSQKYLSQFIWSGLSGKAGSMPKEENNEYHNIRNGLTKR